MLETVVTHLKILGKRLRSVHVSGSVRSRSIFHMLICFFLRELFIVYKLQILF